MNEYLFYTIEGYTQDTGMNEVENCQMLGRVMAHNAEEARINLTKQESWLQHTAFDIDNVVDVQIFTNEQKTDIKAVVDYLWTDEQRHYEECGKPDNHFFKTLDKLRRMYESKAVCLNNC